MSFGNDYVKFEILMTLKMEDALFTALTPTEQEALRELVLKTRVLCRDAWLAMGKEIPEGVKFIGDEE